MDAVSPVDPSSPRLQHSSFSSSFPFYIPMEQPNKFLEEAIKQYEQNIESGKSFYMDASVLMDIEEFYEKQNKNYEAEQLMRFAERLHPDSEDVLIVKAYRLKNQGLWSEALAIVSNIPNPQNRDVQLLLAEWDVAAGLPDSAESRINDNLPAEMSMEDYDWMLDLAEIYIDYGYLDRAKKWLLPIPNNYPLRPRVDEILGDIYYQQDDYEKSMEAFNRILDAQPYDATTWVQVAEIQQRFEHLEESIASCDYALAIEPTNARAINLKIFNNFGLGHYDEAMKLANQYFAILPNDYSLHMYVGEQLIATNKSSTEALFHLRNALRRCPIDNPDRLRIIRSIIYTLSEMGRTEEATELTRTTIIFGQNFSEAYSTLAGMCFETNQREAGIRTLIELLKRPTVSPEDYLNAIKMLIQYNCGDECYPFWVFLATLKDNKVFPPLYAYAASNLHTFRDPDNFEIAIKKAAEKCPDHLVKHFGEIYDTKEINEILLLAQLDIERWREERER